MVSVGTTGTTAVDPLAEIVPLAQRYGMWVHIDAAMAGSALLLPEMRWLVDGVEGADSLNWNPHKWLGTLGDCSLLYVADPAELIRVMSTNPSYLRSAVDGEVTQYKDWGIPLGRRFRALKLWFQLRLDGVEAIRTRLRRDLDNARWLAGQVEAAPGWRVLAPVVLPCALSSRSPTRPVRTRRRGGRIAEEARHADQQVAGVRDVIEVHLDVGQVLGQGAFLGLGLFLCFLGGRDLDVGEVAQLLVGGQHQAVVLIGLVDDPALVALDEVTRQPQVMGGEVGEPVRGHLVRHPEHVPGVLHRQRPVGSVTAGRAEIWRVAINRDGYRGPEPSAPMSSPIGARSCGSRESTHAIPRRRASTAAFR